MTRKTWMTIGALAGLCPAWGTTPFQLTNESVWENDQFTLAKGTSRTGTIRRQNGQSLVTMTVWFLDEHLERNDALNPVHAKFRVQIEKP